MVTEEAAATGVDQACRTLRLPTIRTQVSRSGRPGHRRADVLSRVPGGAAAGRVRRSFPPSVRAPDQGRSVPTRQGALPDFDFEANPNIDPAIIHTLAKCN